MTSRDELVRENEALRERTSRLSTAILRITASLEPGTVLQEIVDSARTLTGARYGVIVTIDETGEVRDFVTSGFTPDETRETRNIPAEFMRNMLRQPWGCDRPAPKNPTACWPG